MAKCAEAVLKDAQSKVPVKTGALRDSLKINKVSDTKYEVGSDLNYSIFIELGTRNMNGKHFLRKALLNRRNYNKG